MGGAFSGVRGRKLKTTTRIMAPTLEGSSNSLVIMIQIYFPYFLSLFFSFFPTLSYYLILSTSPKGRLPHVKADFLRR